MKSSGPVFSNSMPANCVRLTDFEFGLSQRLKLYSTSSVVKSSPFDHFTFGCSLNDQTFRSSEGVQLAAR